MADFKCAKCSRTFSMAAHLARHMNATHGARRKTAGAKKRAKGKNGRRVKRGRQQTTGVNLGRLSLDYLTQLIGEARAEIRQRIAAIEKMM
ncbi:MAG: C2H2-type zinc finger protein [Planctomycetota bacterium]